MIVFLDRQHTGQPNKIHSRGAENDLNDDGKIEIWETEAHWTGYLSIMLEVQLVQAGVKVIPISDGSYLARHTRVNEYSKMFKEELQVYIALHLNAGGGDYGSMFYYEGSTQGKALSESICESLGHFLPQVKTFKSIQASPTDWTQNAFNTIKGVSRPVGICSEPLFIDTHKSLISVDGMAKVALGMSTGVLSWMKKQ